MQQLDCSSLQDKDTAAGSAAVKANTSAASLSLSLPFQCHALSERRSSSLFVQADNAAMTYRQSLAFILLLTMCVYMWFMNSCIHPYCFPVLTGIYFRDTCAMLTFNSCTHATNASRTSNLGIPKFRAQIRSLVNPPRTQVLHELAQLTD